MFGCVPLVAAKLPSVPAGWNHGWASFLLDEHPQNTPRPGAVGTCFARRRFCCARRPSRAVSRLLRCV